LPQFVILGPKSLYFNIADVGQQVSISINLIGDFLKEIIFEKVFSGTK